MTCPECGDEFREGFIRCPDCNVDLILELPVDIEDHLSEGVSQTGAVHDLSDSVELLRTENVPFVMVVKSMLEAAGIPISVQGEHALDLMTVLPSGHSGWPALFGMTVHVPSSRYEEALALLEPLEDEDNPSAE